MTLQEIAKLAATDAPPVQAEIACQIVRLRPNVTKAGKPFLDLEISDGTGLEKFKIWEDSEAFALCRQAREGDAVHLEGSFWRNQFGLNVDRLRLRWLEQEEATALFAGSPERRAFLEGEWQGLVAGIETIGDPRLRLLAQTFLAEHEIKFCRAAAARDYHHARRGGLLEHTAQMLRSALALAPVYPRLNWDLVKSGILFHDAGKLWELDYPAQGFLAPLTTRGELLGHITIGIELVNRLWRGLEAHPAMIEATEPPREQVREHLLHLVAAHHGIKEYGSPVTPRTREAWMLHHIDNIDAYQEMVTQTYLQKAQTAPGIYEQRRPLEGRIVEGLPVWRGD